MRYDWVMTKVIAQRELRNQNAAVMAAVAAGETFVVTRRGERVAELRPLAGRNRTFVTKGALGAVAAQGPHLDGPAFRADLERIADQRL